MLFEESEESDDEEQNTEYGASLRDARMFFEDEDAMKVASAYRTNCKKFRVLPVNKLLERMASDGIDVIDASNMQLLATNLRPIAAMCSQLGHLRVLDVSNNNLKEEGGIILGENMSGNLRR